jgi:preprotein translocase subunit SecY
MVGATSNRLEDLKKKVFVTVMLLVVYRVAAQVPVPGINASLLEKYWSGGSGGRTVFDLINTFSGGAFKRFTVVALGIMPYITTSIIFSLLGEVFPKFQELQEDSEGHKKIQRWTRYATVILCAFQGYGLSTYMEGLNTQGAGAIVADPGMWFRITATMTLAAGTMFLLWLGERITEYGLENGVSLIIFAGIAVELPIEIYQKITLFNSGDITFIRLTTIFVTMIAAFFIVCFIERSIRPIPVQYAKKVVHNRVFGGAQTLPMKVDTAGVMPPILAYALISAPATVLTFVDQTSSLRKYIEPITSSLMPNGILFNVVLAVLIFYMAYFYAPIQFKTKKISEQLQKNNAFVPGVRPGSKTREFLDYVLNRLTTFSGLYLCVICILPGIFIGAGTRISGTALLILVSVCIRVMMNIQTFLHSERYESAYKVRGKHKGAKKRF